MARLDEIPEQVAFPPRRQGCGANQPKEIPVMATGTVKWFNTTKGYGFIAPDEGGKDVFVHITAVQAAGLRGLDDGQRIEYELSTDRGKTAASNLKIS